METAAPLPAGPRPAPPPGATRPDGPPPSGVPRGRAAGAALVLCSVTSLQLGAALSSSLFPLVGPAGATALRLAAAAVLMLLLVRPPVRRWSRRQWRAALLLGAALAAMNGLFYQSISRIPLGIAVTVEFLGPLGLAAALSRRRRDVLCVAAALVGVVVLGTRHSGAHAIDPAGLMLAVGAGVCWAGYILAGAGVASSGTGRGGLAIATAVAALVSVPIGVAGAGVRLLHPHILLVGALVGVLASAVPYSCEIAALERLPKKTFSILLALEPAAAALAGAALLGQGLPAASVAAIGLVMAAGVASTLGAA